MYHKQHALLRHIENDYVIVNEKLNVGSIKLLSVSSIIKLTYILTKALPSTTFPI